MGLQIELFNQNAYQISHNESDESASGNHIINSRIRFVNKGVRLYHYVSGSDDRFAITDFHLENSILSYIDTTAVDSYFSWSGVPSPEKFTYAGIRNSVIRGNSIHHIGFNSDLRSAVGMRIFYPDKWIIENNHIHHIAHNGIHLHLSVIDSEKTFDLNPEEIKIGEILVKDNLIEKTCQAGSDCGALKIGGSNRPYSHVFRDVLVIGNTFRHNFGWYFWYWY